MQQSSRYRSSQRRRKTEIHSRWISFRNPDRTRAVRSECRQEERAEEEDISQALDLSAGSDHCWIGENLHGV
jgi:hypothetical protein